VSFIIADFVRETSLTTGTFAIQLSGLRSPGQTFSSVLANGDTLDYTIAHASLNEFETGLGTYDSGTNSLARSLVYASSNGNSLVNFSPGTKNVDLSYPAERIKQTTNSILNLSASVTASFLSASNSLSFTSSSLSVTDRSIQSQINSVSTSATASFLSASNSITTTSASINNTITNLRTPQFVVLAATGETTNERVLTSGGGVTLADAGAGSTLTLGINNSIVATVSGTTFTQLTGSIQKTASGVSYLAGSPDVFISSASNGQIGVSLNPSFSSSLVNVINSATSSFNTLTSRISSVEVSATASFLSASNSIGGLSSSVVLSFVSSSNALTAASSSFVTTINNLSSTVVSSFLSASNSISATSASLSVTDRLLSQSLVNVIVSTTSSFNTLTSRITSVEVSATASFLSASNSINSLSSSVVLSFVSSSNALTTTSASFATSERLLSQSLVNVINSATSSFNTLTSRIASVEVSATASFLSASNSITATSSSFVTTINNLSSTIVASFVSASNAWIDKASNQTMTGNKSFSGGLSGSVQNLSNGTSYLVAGTNVTIASASSGQVTISAISAGSGDPNASYVVIGLTGSLNAERALTAGTGLLLTDGGVNSNVTLAITSEFSSSLRDVIASATSSLNVLTSRITSVEVSATASFLSASNSIAVTSSSFVTTINNLSSTVVSSFLSSSNATQLTSASFATSERLLSQSLVNVITSATASFNTLTSRISSVEVSATASFLSASNSIGSLSSSVILSFASSSTSLQATSASINGAITNLRVPSFVTLGTSSELSNERVLTQGGGITLTDAGAGSTTTLGINNNLIATVTGSTFAQLSGSLQRLADGTSYLVAGAGMTVSSGSNGQITLTTTLADPGAAYVLIGTTGSLANERALAVGAGLLLVDGGAGGNVTLSITSEFSSSLRDVIVSSTSSLNVLTSRIASVEVSATASFLSASNSIGSLSSSIVLSFVSASNSLQSTSASFATSERLLSQSLVNVIVSTTASFLSASTSITTTSASINSTINALRIPSFIALASSNELTNERTLTQGGGITLTDAGAGSTLTLGINNNVISTISGSTFSQLTGSIQKLADGTSYLVAGSNITISSASNGQIMISSPTSGGAADPGAAYVLIGTTGSLVNERALVAGTGLSLTDTGAGGNVTLAITSEFSSSLRDVIASSTSSFLSASNSITATSSSFVTTISNLSSTVVASFLSSSNALTFTSASFTSTDRLLSQSLVNIIVSTTSSFNTLTSRIASVEVSATASFLSASNSIGSLSSSVILSFASSSNALAATSSSFVTTISNLSSTVVASFLSASNSISTTSASLSVTDRLLSQSLVNVIISTTSSFNTLTSRIASVEVSATASFLSASNSITATSSSFVTTISNLSSSVVTSFVSASNVWVDKASNQTISGNKSFSGGLSGSVQNLSNGTSYIVAGTNITITSASSGQVTISSTATGGGADPGANYVLIGTTGSLANERALTAGSDLNLTDAGAGGNVTIGLNQSFSSSLVNVINSATSSFNALTSRIDSVEVSATASFLSASNSIGALSSSVALSFISASNALTTTSSSFVTSISSSFSDSIFAGLRVSQSTFDATGSVSSIPDSYTTNPATQTNNLRRPTFQYSDNGQPCLRFLTNDTLSWPITPSNSGNQRWGVAFWVKFDDLSGVKALFTTMTTGGASANRLRFYQQTSGLTCEIYATSVAGRFVNAANCLTLGWNFVSFEYDSLQPTEATKAVITVNGSARTTSFGNQGGGAAIGDLISVTGTHVIGDIQNGAPSLPLNGVIGPNLFLFGSKMFQATTGLLTNRARLQLMDYEKPIDLATIQPGLVDLTTTQSITGSKTFLNGLSGSLQQLSGGSSYLVAGTNVTIASASNGQVTISSTATGGSGDSNASYVVIGLTGSLSAERALTAGTGLSLIDGGANSNVTLAITNEFSSSLRDVIATTTSSFNNLTSRIASVEVSATASFLSASNSIGALSSSVVASFLSSSNALTFTSASLSVTDRLLSQSLVNVIISATASFLSASNSIQLLSSSVVASFLSSSNALTFTSASLRDADKLLSQSLTNVIVSATASFLSASNSIGSLSSSVVLSFASSSVALQTTSASINGTIANLRVPSFVTLGTTIELTNERVLTQGGGITLTDAGAGSTVTLGINNNTIATVSGSTFTQLSGSLQKLANGTSYLVGGIGVNVTSASNGQITLTTTGTLLRAPQYCLTGTLSIIHPVGTRIIFVKGVGGGGAGGGSAATAYTGGACGGSATYAEKTITISSLTSTYVIGAAGAGVSGADGGDGGSSSFTNGSTTVSVPGGSGGSISSTAAGTWVTAAGGPGGGNATNADFSINGQRGGSYVRDSQVTPARWHTDAGGSCCLGNGGASQARIDNTSVAGGAATGFGSGGGGRLQGNSAVANPGAAGTAGVWMVEEYSAKIKRLQVVEFLYGPDHERKNVFCVRRSNRCR